MLRTTLALAMALALPAGAAFAESHGMEGITGDPEKGEKVFRKCKACHQVGADAQNKTGPVLNGIVGHEMAVHEGFKYSDAMLAKAEEMGTWTPEHLTEFLHKPKDYVKGTKMSFAGLRKDEEIADVIAYLATFNMEGEQGGS